MDKLSRTDRRIVHDKSWAMRRKYCFTVSTLVSDLDTAISPGLRYFFERYLQGPASTPLPLRPPCLPRRERVPGLRDTSQK